MSILCGLGQNSQPQFLICKMGICFLILFHPWVCSLPCYDTEWLRASCYLWNWINFDEEG